MSTSDTRPAVATAHTIGWIAPRHHELAASIAMLDERYDTPADFIKNPADDNQYTWGRMGRHRVVVASLPSGEFGSNVATQTATSMLASLPWIRVGLLVGTGSGIPGPEYDIRLGDIVVSEPQGRTGGVIQYDLAKAKDGEMVRTGMLNLPPTTLLNALTKLQAEHEISESTIPALLKDMWKRNPKMSNANREKTAFIYQGAENDRYHRNYKLVSREHRKSTEPEIHYGTIASGNTVIEEVTVRDAILARLQGTEDILALDTEAAGLMNNFPCLVIRGISDYADEYKTDMWQRYAAATAAAFAKEFLVHLDVQETVCSFSIGEILKGVDRKIDHINQVIAKGADESERREMLEWICETNYRSRYQDFITRQLHGTGQWLLRHPEFTQWTTSQHSVLLCLGMPGAGKTILASSVIKLLQDQQNPQPVLYVYCNYKTREQQTADRILAALLRQILELLPAVPEHVQRFYHKHRRAQVRPTLDQARENLEICLKCVDGASLVVDGLDESCEDIRQHLLAALGSIRVTHLVRIFATSRHVDSVKQAFFFKGCAQIDVAAPPDDLRCYVMKRLDEFQEHRLTKDMQDDIVHKVITAADGAFLLAKLAMDSLQSKALPAQIRLALHVLPKGSDAYDVLYESVMQRITEQGSLKFDLARRILSWVVFARRSLRVSELKHALAVQPGQTTLDLEWMPLTGTITSLCIGLVIIDQKSDTVSLVHHTAHEFLERKRDTWIPQAESLLARSCNAYLMLKECALPPHYHYDDLNATTNDLMFLAYAVDYWGSHARACQESDQLQGIRSELLAFLRSDSTVFAVQIRRYERLRKKISDQCRGLDSVDGMDMAGVVDNWPKAIHWLCWSGLHSLLDEFPEDSLHSLDEEGRTPFWWAASEGSTKSIRNLLRRARSDVNLSDRSLVTPLMIACSNGRAAAVELLLESKLVHIDTRNKWIQTSLHLAAENGHESIVRQLLNTHELDVNAQDFWGQTPLLISSSHDKDAVVELLLESGEVDVNISDTNHQSPILVAAEKGHARTVKLLVEHKKTDLNAKDNRHRTALLIAAYKGFETVSELLVRSNRVDVSQKDWIGRTPLLGAVLNGSDGIVRLLWSTGGADIYAEDCDGQSPILAAFEKDRPSLIEFLFESIEVEKSTQITSPLLGGPTSRALESAVHTFLQSGHRVDEIVSKLVGRVRGQNRIHEYAERFYRLLSPLLRRMLSLLEKLKTDQEMYYSDGQDSVRIALNQQGPAGETALSCAARHGDYRTVRALLTTGYVAADIPDLEGRTPLWHAASGGCSKTVEGLLAREDVIPGLSSRRQESLIMVAARNGHESVVQALLASHKVFRPTRLAYLLELACVEGGVVDLILSNAMAFGSLFQQMGPSRGGLLDPYPSLSWPSPSLYDEEATSPSLVSAGDPENDSTSTTGL